jgi:beta-lactamase superfamily II metal-dependent hydrolase
MKYFTYAETVTVLVSHGHNDHFNYIGYILDYLATKGTKLSIQALLGGRDTDYNANFMKNLSDVSATPVTTPYNFCDNTNIRFEFLFSDSRYANPNQRGMLMKLSCSTCKSDLLFTGDMEGPAADAFAKNQAAFLDSTHYKMAHHGASTLANKEAWLEAISPVEVHVSHVFNGHYKHPRCEAVRLILDLNTVGTTTINHPFTCFENDGTEISGQTQLRMYSTAPTAGELCLIEMTFSANSEADTAYYCAPPTSPLFS